MESLNAVFIEQRLQQGERLLKLNQIAIQQMKVLEDDENRIFGTTVCGPSGTGGTSGRIGF